MKWKTGILLSMAMATGASDASDADGNYVVWGAGATSCNTYLTARETDADLSKHKGFLMGYLTAYNAMTPDTVRISGNSDLNDLLAWLDDYCDGHRLDSFERAIKHLLQDLEPRKWKSTPQKGGAWTR